MNEEIEQFIDDLYLSRESMANARSSKTDKRFTVPTFVNQDQLGRLKALGLPEQKSRVTIWRAIKYLENISENRNGNSSSS